MAMFVVKCIHIQINGQVMDLSITKTQGEQETPAHFLPYLFIYLFIYLFEHERYFPSREFESVSSQSNAYITMLQISLL